MSEKSAPKAATEFAGSYAKNSKVKLGKAVLTVGVVNTALMDPYCDLGPPLCIYNSTLGPLIQLMRVFYQLTLD